jgi:hypothetical protein
MGFQIPNFGGPGMDDDDNDDDLEAELQRLQQDTGAGRGSKANKGKADLLTFYCRIMKDILYVYRWNSTKSSSIS